MKGVESLLCSILDCGYSDLSILNDVGHDLREIVDYLHDMGVHPTLNAITDEIFRKGVDAFKYKIKDRIHDLEHRLESCENNEIEELRGQIDTLQYLDPDEDIEWHCNYLDTSISFSDNEEIYRKHLANEISEIEDDMGFKF